MGDLQRLDDGIRPVPLTKPLRIYFLASKLQTRLMTWSSLGIVAEIVLYSQLMQEGFTLAAWARFLLPHALVLPFALSALVRQLRREVGKLEFTEEGVRLFQPGEGTTEVSYEDIDEYRLGIDLGYWFRFHTWDGRQFGISRRASVITADAEAKIVRTLGPRLSPSAAQSRGVPPSDPIERYAWDHFGDPPPVAMVPGKRYRYRSPNYLYGAKGDLTVVFTQLPFLIPALFFLRGLPLNGFVATVLTIYAAIMLLTSGRYWRAFLLRQAGHDRFELTDEGIRVIRGARTWILRNPRPATGFLWGAHRFGRYLERYGRGRHTYFFDPRFLEEDL